MVRHLLAALALVCGLLALPYVGVFTPRTAWAAQGYGVRDNQGNIGYAFATTGSGECSGYPVLSYNWSVSNQGTFSGAPGYTTYYCNILFYTYGQGYHDTVYPRICIFPGGSYGYDGAIGSKVQGC